MRCAAQGGRGSGARPASHEISLDCYVSSPPALKSRFGDGPAVETERPDADGTDGTETAGAATARSAGARSGDEAAPAAEKTDPADQPAEELPGKPPGRPLPAVAQPAPTTAS